MSHWSIRLPGANGWQPARAEQAVGEASSTHVSAAGVRRGLWNIAKAALSGARRALEIQRTVVPSNVPPLPNSPRLLSPLNSGMPLVRCSRG